MRQVAHYLLTKHENTAKYMPLRPHVLSYYNNQRTAVIFARNARKAE